MPDPRLKVTKYTDWSAAELSSLLLGVPQHLGPRPKGRGSTATSALFLEHFYVFGLLMFLSHIGPQAPCAVIYLVLVRIGF